MEKKILLIDDEKSLCSKVKLFLSNKGFDVTTAYSGKKAIELLKKEQYPLVITDIIMPDIDGLEVLKIIHTKFPDSLVIIITAYASLDTAIDALRKKAYDYITKPFDNSALLKSINKAFQVLGKKKLKKKAEEKLKKLAVTDDLTGLFNQGHFYKALSNEIKRAKRYNNPLSLMILDLDNLKYFNDTFGHREGDKALKTSAKVIKKCMRDIDLCFRYGGDEFAVILPETEMNNALNVAERIRLTLKNTKFSLRGTCKMASKACITTSIGLSEYKKDYSLEDFVRYSDAFVYQSKKLGGNKVCYELKKNTFRK